MTGNSFSPPLAFAISYGGYLLPSATAAGISHSLEPKKKVEKKTVTLTLSLSLSILAIVWQESEREKIPVMEMECCSFSPVVFARNDNDDDDDDLSFQARNQQQQAIPCLTHSYSLSRSLLFPGTTSVPFSSSDFSRWPVGR
jgi:hypothetical protein